MAGTTAASKGGHEGEQILRDKERELNGRSDRRGIIPKPHLPPKLDFSHFLDSCGLLGSADSDAAERPLLDRLCNINDSVDVFFPRLFFTF